MYPSLLCVNNVVVPNNKLSRSLDITMYEVLLEDGGVLNLEYETSSSITLESYIVSTFDVGAQNDKFEAEISVLDFTERNPFGEVYNQ